MRGGYCHLQKQLIVPDFHICNNQIIRIVLFLLQVLIFNCLHNIKVLPELLSSVCYTALEIKMFRRLRFEWNNVRLSYLSEEGAQVL